MSSSPQDQESEDSQGDVSLTAEMKEYTSGNAAAVLDNPVLNYAEGNQLKSIRSLKLGTSFPESPVSGPASQCSGMQGPTVDVLSMEDMVLACRNVKSLANLLKCNCNPDEDDDPKTSDPLAIHKSMIEQDKAKVMMDYTKGKKDSGIDTSPGPSTSAYLGYPGPLHTALHGLDFPSPSIHCPGNVTKSDNFETELGFSESDQDIKLMKTLKSTGHNWRKYPKSRIHARNPRPTVFDWLVKEERVVNLTTLDAKDSVLYLPKPSTSVDKSSSLIKLSEFKPLPQLKKSIWTQIKNKFRVPAPLLTMPTSMEASEQGPGTLKEDESFLKSTKLEGVKTGWEYLKV